MIRLVTALAVGSTLSAASPGESVAQLASEAAATSAPISNVRYEVTFDRKTARSRSLAVAMHFDTKGAEPVVLSLPAWTPGAYEIDNFARKVLDFAATNGDGPVRWDKVDYDTWRIFPTDAERITVRFDYRADTLENASSWSTDDFLLFNGTNVFLYPEGQGLDFSARVAIHTEIDWQVVTGMRRSSTGGYREANFHDLVDMPVFVGPMDVDSMRVRGKWYRLASYPSGAFVGRGREVLWTHIGAMMSPMHAVFGGTPWESYSTLLIFDDEFPGGAALEHQNSHVGIYSPQFIGSLTLSSITAHEIFHAWNVKRLRPAAMVPYDYSRPQPTPLLWMSEGVTDYYADLALVRSDIVSAGGFYALTARKMQQVAEAPPTALEDASLSAWISPVDGSGQVYYPKGSLVGLLLDIQIREATDNRASLDDVMRDLYESTYQQGYGFTTAGWWEAVGRVAEEKDFGEFAARFVDGRDPLPMAETLALAGLLMEADTGRVARIGIFAGPDSAGIVIRGVSSDGSAAEAGVREGDYLLRVGDVEVAEGYGRQFRERYVDAEEGTPYEIVVRRGEDTLTLNARLRFEEVVNFGIEEDQRAPARAIRIREGILQGETVR